MLAAPMNRLHPKAIFIAMLLSLALDVVGSIVLVALFGGRFDDGLTPEQMEAALREITDGTPFLLASLLYGTATTFIGGYIAARLARSHPYFNALAVGVLGLLLSLLLSDTAPWWFDVLGFLSTLPAAVAGGHLFVRGNAPRYK
jgi:hypothetical protein